MILRAVDEVLSAVHRKNEQGIDSNLYVTYVQVVYMTVDECVVLIDDA